MIGKLTEEPSARPRSIGELTGLAAAMEAEAVARYEQLAAEMERQGESVLAATFRTLLEEERHHDAIGWSGSGRAAERTSVLVMIGPCGKDAVIVRRQAWWPRVAARAGESGEDHAVAAPTAVR